jgi:hypothetical protein
MTGWSWRVHLAGFIWIGFCCWLFYCYSSLLLCSFLLLTITLKLFMAALRRVFFNPKNYFSFHPLNSFYRPMMNCTYGHLKIPNQPPRNHAFANLPMIGLLSMSLSMTAILGAMAVTRPSIPTFICELIGPFTLPLTTSFKYLFVGPYSSCSNY